MCNCTYKAPRGVRFVDIESRMVVIGQGEGGLGSCLMEVEFQFGKMNNSEDGWW